MKNNNHKSLIIWLRVLCAILLFMIAVGGVTRLTDSGLSMVDWKPIMGAIPPMNAEEWNQTFEKYKAFPEYQKINVGMTLPEFKKIFFWEYMHRLLGRLIGVAFFFPFLYFLIRKKIPKGYVMPLLIAFLGGALQGGMGWYMVMSGLVDNPSVSHYRLAAHLLLAFLILGYLYYLSVKLKYENQVQEVTEKPGRNLTIFWRALLLLFILQVTYGAFTAGLNAGYVYNEFPLMAGEFIPSAIQEAEGIRAKFVDHIAGVQWVHRTLGWLVLFLSFGFFVLSRKLQNRPVLKRKIFVFVHLILLQFLLGVATLLTHVHLHTAVTHQVMAALLFMTAVNVEFWWRREKL